MLRDLRYDVFKGVLSRSYHDFHSVNTADYISAITNDINILEESYFTPFLYGIQQVCIFSGALIALLSLSLAITFCLILCVVLAMFFPGLYSKVLQKKQRDYSCQLSSFTKVSKDYYNGFEVIKSFGLVPVFLQKFYIDNKLLASVKMKKDNAFNFNESISFFFSFFFSTADITFWCVSYFI
uniref:ABC transporter transmembrane domain-containing protein n=1 Tax=Clostridium sp. NkU-1 TaxID=1095009 RepID=UPI000A5397AD